MSDKKREDFEKKMRKEHGEFVDVVQGMSVEDLDSRLLGLAKHQEEVDEAISSNEQILLMKERLKELVGPFKDTKKALKMKMKYLHLLIKEKGGK